MIEGRHQVCGDLCHFLFGYRIGRILFTSLKDVLKCSTIPAGLLGCVIFAAAMVKFQGVRPETYDFTEEPSQTKGDLLLNANPTTLSSVMGSNGKSTGEVTSGQVTSVDCGFAPEINHPDVLANATSWSPANRPDSARVIRPKIPDVKYRSFVHPRYVDVKTRLIALWHQTLQREKSRGWTLYSKSNKWQRKKISYTAEASH